MNQATYPTLAIVVPCYNESEAFPPCQKELTQTIERLILQNKIASDSYILFIDDGSKDNTWEQIETASKQSPHVRGIKLSRNKGHQLALIAGLTYAHQDTNITVSIDADLQDDTSTIDRMVDAYLDGNEIVYGIRSSRQSDTWFKRITAESFYKLMEWMGVEQTFNHADFRLLSQKALDALLQYKEQNIYIRGLVPLIGFKSTDVYYSRAERVAGESKYPLKKMLGLAAEGITSLTITPLRIITALGFLICLISFFTMLYTIGLKIAGLTMTGWTSMMIAIFFLGGVQMLSLGIIGEYIGKIYLEVKQRPKFFIEKVSQSESKNDANS